MPSSKLGRASEWWWEVTTCVLDRSAPRSTHTQKELHRGSLSIVWLLSAPSPSTYAPPTRSQTPISPLLPPSTLPLHIPTNFNPTRPTQFLPSLAHPIPLQKGKGAVVHTESELRDSNDQVVYRYMSGAFAVGARNFTDGGRSLSVVVDTPKRAPDAVVEERVGEQQAQIYRLSGDYNPLHIDPATAQMGVMFVGFEQILALHGSNGVRTPAQEPLDRCERPDLCGCADPTCGRVLRHPSCTGFAHLASPCGWCSERM